MRTPHIPGVLAAILVKGSLDRRQPPGLSSPRCFLTVAEGRGEQPSLDTENELTAPFGAFRSDGRFRWSEVM